MHRALADGSPWTRMIAFGCAGLPIRPALPKLQSLGPAQANSCRSLKYTLAPAFNRSGSTFVGTWADRSAISLAGSFLAPGAGGTALAGPATVAAEISGAGDFRNVYCIKPKAKIKRT